jgi:hypothetical protein
MLLGVDTWRLVSTVRKIEYKLLHLNIHLEPLQCMRVPQRFQKPAAFPPSNMNVLMPPSSSTSLSNFDPFRLSCFGQRLVRLVTAYPAAQR